MSVEIQYGDFVFAATPIGYIPVSDFSTSAHYYVEETRRANKMPSVARRGQGAKPISFSADFESALGVDPQQSFARLEALCLAGKPLPLYINGESAGKYQFILEDVSTQKVEFHHGAMARMTISVDFTEYPRKVSKAEMKAANKRVR